MTYFELRLYETSSSDLPSGGLWVFCRMGIEKANDPIWTESVAYKHDNNITVGTILQMLVWPPSAFDQPTLEHAIVGKDAQEIADQISRNKNSNLIAKSSLDDSSLNASISIDYALMTSATSNYFRR